jgi:hypothetical protein
MLLPSLRDVGARWVRILALAHNAKKGEKMAQVFACPGTVGARRETRRTAQTDEIPAGITQISLALLRVSHYCCAADRGRPKAICSGEHQVLERKSNGKSQESHTQESSSKGQARGGQADQGRTLQR